MGASSWTTQAVEKPDPDAWDCALCAISIGEAQYHRFNSNSAPREKISLPFIHFVGSASAGQKLYSQGLCRRIKSYAMMVIEEVERGQVPGIRIELAVSLIAPDY